MSNINIKLHYFQQKLISKLSEVTGAKFNELMLEGLVSEHMNYHLKKLIELGLVEKKDELYKLSDAGKDYFNMMDDEVKAIEKQPKTSVSLNVVRKNSESGEIEFLLCKRLKQPYFGKVGKLTGKVRFGETLEEAAKRELYEESGLEADTVVLEEVYHKLRYKEGKPVQDVLFYVFFMTDIKGNLIQHADGQENLWVTERDIVERDDIDPFDDFKLPQFPGGELQPLPLRFVENIAEAEGY